MQVLLQYQSKSYYIIGQEVKCQMIGNMPMLPHYTRKETETTLQLPTYSLTCVCCKLMEHIVVSNFMRHLETNHILNPNQHGSAKVSPAKLNL